jgi:mannose-6-phosphate isomerase-like protein (cupin superfamily)
MAWIVVPATLAEKLMQKIVALWLVILGAVTAPAAAQRRGAGGGNVTFAVAVADPSGAPIAGVKVSATGPATRSGTTEAGRLVFENLPAGTYTFRFDKAGFVPFEKELTGRGSAPIDVKVTLDPAPAPPPPVARTPALPPPPPSDAKPVVLDMPAFIEKNYVGRAPGKVTTLACAAGGTATLMQINEPVPTHTHQDGDEFIYVIAGQGTAVFGERQESLSAGVFLSIPRDVAHSFVAGPKKPLVLVSIKAGERCQ